MPSDFIAKYPPVFPQLRPAQQTQEQLELLSDNEGVKQLPIAPVHGVMLTYPATHEKAKQLKSLYLWLICDSQPRVMFANETEPAALEDGRQRICHTNLSGGQPASGGGEFWFENNDKVIINGCSGRYPIRTLEQLIDAAAVFVRLGYETGHGGWDEDLDMPRRLVRENDITWMPSER